MKRKETLLRELKEQVTHLENELAGLSQRSSRYANIRLATFVLGVVASGASLLSYGVWIWLAVTFLALSPFVVSVYFHRRVEARMNRDTALLRLKRADIARMTLDWQNIPAPLSEPPPPDHPFAGDLDIVGARSLHQLLDTAVSREGSQRLLSWLVNTDLHQERIVKRQADVQEVMPLNSFREELALSARMVPTAPGEKWPGARLLEWLEAGEISDSLGRVLLVLLPLALINIVLALLYAAGQLPAWWLVTWLIYATVSLAQRRKIGDPFEDAFFLRDGLDNLSHVFGFLENYPFEGKPRLRQLCRPLLTEGKRPSQQLTRVRSVVAAIALQKNFVLWFWLNAVIPWDIYFVHRLNRSKQELAKLLPLWLDVWFELEATSSLAHFAYLNPEASFPEIQCSDDSSQLNSVVIKGIGHPLIPSQSRVYNDFSAEIGGTILVITGSNMAGKSTFLKTLGVNLSLAYAGGPVIAQTMQVPLLRLFTALRVSDSVVDGFSYFYAEVRRLRELLNALELEGCPPLFYLIDEIFRGTNNRERLIGSRAYVRALADGVGIGVIATHDLELVKLAKELPGVINFHFRDDVRDGRMVFDYKLRPGPCPTTNALKIMRLAGLPVDHDV